MHLWRGMLGEWLELECRRMVKIHYTHEWNSLRNREEQIEHHLLCDTLSSVNAIKSCLSKVVSPSISTIHDKSHAQYYVVQYKTYSNLFVCKFFDLLCLGMVCLSGLLFVCFNIFAVFFFWDMISQCSSGCPGAYAVNKAGL